MYAVCSIAVEILSVHLSVKRVHLDTKQKCQYIDSVQKRNLSSFFPLITVAGDGLLPPEIYSPTLFKITPSFTSLAFRVYK